MQELIFTIRVAGIKTLDLPDLPQVVKQVDWILSGEMDEFSYELNSSTILPDPQSQEFIPYNELSQEQVVNWIQTTDPRLDGLKAQVANKVLELKMLSELKPEVLPWAPQHPLPPLPEPLPPPLEDIL